MYQGWKYKYDDNRKIVMECHVEIKWSTTVCQGSSCSAITYFNFFTTLSDLGPWLEVPRSQADSVLSSYLLCPVFCLSDHLGRNKQSPGV